MKYNAWDKSTHNMIPWDTLKNWLVHNIFDNPNMIPIKSTGYKDKKGNDIFEDDIIYSEIYNSHFRIEFIEGDVCTIPPKLSEQYHSIDHFYPSIGCQIEVVGNIYENPELIGK